MYNEEWEPVMTADSMEEKVEEFAKLAQSRADEKDKAIEDVVHNLTHQSYLMKHTTSDVLRELQELNETYPDAFYNGAANDHLMEYAEQDVNFEFWYDHLNMFLAAGLEWAILEEVEESPANA